MDRRGGVTFLRGWDSQGVEDLFEGGLCSGDGDSLLWGVSSTHEPGVVAGTQDEFSVYSLAGSTPRPVVAQSELALDQSSDAQSGVRERGIASP